MRKSNTDRDAHLYHVEDADSGRKIQDVLWADDETGEYEIVVNDPGYARAYGEQRTERRTGNIRLVRLNDH